MEALAQLPRKMCAVVVLRYLEDVRGRDRHHEGLFGRTSDQYLRANPLTVTLAGRGSAPEATDLGVLAPGDSLWLRFSCLAAIALVTLRVSPRHIRPSARCRWWRRNRAGLRPL